MFVWVLGWIGAACVCAHILFHCTCPHNLTAENSISRTSKWPSGADLFVPIFARLQSQIGCGQGHFSNLYPTSPSVLCLVASSCSLLVCCSSFRSRCFDFRCQYQCGWGQDHCSLPAFIPLSLLPCLPPSSCSLLVCYFSSCSGLSFFFSFPVSF